MDKKEEISKEDKKRIFYEIVEGIKTLKIQGARAVAERALYAYELIPTQESKKILLSLRPTEPLLQYILKHAEEKNHKQVINHFKETQKKINQEVFKLIKNNFVVFTHCHSSSVVKSLIYAKRKGRKFEVYNTETRPLFQGRKTAEELRKSGIKITMFVDSALGVALSKKQGTKKVDLVFLGADALFKKGIANKIGSEIISRIAKQEKIPVYIIADSWKYSRKNLELEKRNLKEIWNFSEKKPNLKIINPAFEFVSKKYITGIITEFGLMKYQEFVDFMKESSDNIKDKDLKILLN